MNNVKIQNPVSVKGAYAYQLIDDATGDIVVDVPEQTNLILDNYLNNPSPRITSPYLCLGAGVVTPPSVLDENLGNQVAQELVSFTGPSSFHSLVPDINPTTAIFKISATKDFTGLSGYDISEIGVRSGSSGPLFTRALIKDSNGNPTQISISDGQTLRLTYSLYYSIYAPRSGDGALQTITTPHGDLSVRWEWPKNLEDFNSTEEGRLCGIYSFTQSWDLHSYANSYGPFGSGASISRSSDTVNREVTTTYSYTAISSDRAAQYFPKPVDNSNKTIIAPAFVIVGSYTLPANYNFTITTKGSWGRLT